MKFGMAFTILFFSSPTGLNRGIDYEFIVWNVGQGSWATLKTSEDCFHFDLGGETNPLASVQKACAGRLNRFYFSHWDWDHTSFAMSARSKLLKTCLAEAPGGSPPKKRTSLLRGLGTCPPSNLVEKIEFTPPKNASANDHSKIFIVLGKILISGDSTTKMEKIWFRRLRYPEKIKVYLLGHHGSRTSTSQVLLENLPNLKQAVTSARKAKYGHPHPTVSARLTAFGIPHVKTEDWGHLHFYFENPPD